MTSDVLLRDVTETDLPILFEQQLDPAANQMAAFTAKDPADRAAFTAKWARILDDDSITKRTVLFGGRVAGSVSAFVAPWSGKLEVTYWILLPKQIQNGRGDGSRRPCLHGQR